MTIHEAILKLSGKEAGFFNRLSVNYAQTLLEPDEIVTAAAIANIFTRKERFPGVVALTDHRVLAVCGLPGVRRCISCTPKSLETCVEKPGAIRYQVSFSDEHGAFSMSIDPDTGEKFSRQIAILKGAADEFDAAGTEDNSFLFNPTLIRSRRRTRREKERKRQERQEVEKKTREMSETVKENILPFSRETARETAERMAEQLETAKKKGRVETTDPKAIAARLAAELAADEEG